MGKNIHQVIVIGVGAAGLTVAHELAKTGWHDVVVLEAQDYIGGRNLAHTSRTAWSSWSTTASATTKPVTPTD